MPVLRPLTPRLPAPRNAYAIADQMSRTIAVHVLKAYEGPAEERDHHFAQARRTLEWYIGEIVRDLKDNPPETVAQLDLPNEVYEALWRENVRLVSDLQELTQDELRRMPKVGKMHFDRIVAKLARHGIFLRE